MSYYAKFANLESIVMAGFINKFTTGFMHTNMNFPYKSIDYGVVTTTALKSCDQSDTV